MCSFEKNERKGHNPYRLRINQPYLEILAVEIKFEVRNQLTTSDAYGTAHNHDGSFDLFWGQIVSVRIED